MRREAIDNPTYIRLFHHHAATQDTAVAVAFKAYAFWLNKVSPIGYR